MDIRDHRNAHEVLLDEIFELADLRRVPQPRERARLDLTDALASDVERLAYFFERARLSVLEAVAHLDHLALSGAELVEQLTDVRVQERANGRCHRLVGIDVLDEVTEARVLFLADRRLERD